jgi:hypothetical protein
VFGGCASVCLFILSLLLLWMLVYAGVEAPLFCAYLYVCLYLVGWFLAGLLCFAFIRSLMCGASVVFVERFFSLLPSRCG